MAYTTLANVRTYLKFNASETGDDTLLTGLIPHAQMLIDNYVGYAFEASADTARKFDAISDLAHTPRAKTFYARTLYFDTYLAQLTSVVFNNTTLQSADYVFEPRNQAPYYAMTILASSPRFWDFDDDSENAITVTGRWAYSVTAPHIIEQACIELVAYMYNKRFQTEGDAPDTSPDGAVMSMMPRYVMNYLAPYRKMVPWR